MYFVCVTEGSKALVGGGVAHQANTLSWRAKHIDRVCCAHSSHVMESSLRSIAAATWAASIVVGERKNTIRTMLWDFLLRHPMIQHEMLLLLSPRNEYPFRTNNWNWHENCIYTLCVATRDGKQKIPFVRYVENGMQKKERKVNGCIAQVINKPTPFHSQSNPLRTHSHNISSTCQSIKITHAKKTNTYMLCIHDVLLWIVEICMYNSGRNSCVSSTWWNLRVCCCAAKMNWIFSLRSFAHWRWIAVNKSVLIFFSLFSRLANPLWSLGEKEKSIK